MLRLARLLVTTGTLMITLFSGNAVCTAQEQFEGKDAPVQSERGKGCADLLRPHVEAKMAELGVPGATVFVDVPGSCRWTASLGRSEVGKPAPMSLHDHVRIGSITKSFTGTAVLQLVDDGTIELTDPISYYLPQVPNGQNITIRQLLQMSSGLYNYSDDVQFNASLDEKPERVWSVPELLDIGFSHQPYFPPGAGFHYSNTNTALLGLLVEKVTGQPLGTVLQKRIFKPLGMKDTSFPELADASIPEPHPAGYMYGTNVGSIPPACDAAAVARHDVTNVSPSWTWAAGGAISTLRDLKVWARALALGTLLSPEMQAERLKWMSTGPPPAPQYGLHIANFFGIIGHDGALPGFQSFVGYLPEKQATIVVLTNLYPDVDCGGPADEIVKVLASDLHLLQP